MVGDQMLYFQYMKHYWRVDMTPPTISFGWKTYQE